MTFSNWEGNRWPGGSDRSLPPGLLITSRELFAQNQGRIEDLLTEGYSWVAVKNSRLTKAEAPLGKSVGMLPGNLEKQFEKEQERERERKRETEKERETLKWYSQEGRD